MGRINAELDKMEEDMKELSDECDDEDEQIVSEIKKKVRDTRERVNDLIAFKDSLVKEDSNKGYV